MESIINNFQTVGLIFDVVGIAILGLPALFRMKSEVAAQMGTYWNYNPPLAKALATSRVDISTGSLILLFGFACQLAAALNYVPLPYTGLIYLILLAAFVLCYWTFMRSYFSSWLFKAALSEHEDQQAAAKEVADAG